MPIITQDYVLTGAEGFSVEKQRQSMELFESKLGSAIFETCLYGHSRKLNYLPIRTLLPEHNEHTVPMLLAGEVRRGASRERIINQPPLRRIYQLGRAAVTIRCVPDFEELTDELHFVFSGVHKRDIVPAVSAIGRVVGEVNSDRPFLEWYKQ